jgi:excisionase family DNA binding protein
MFEMMLDGMDRKAYSVKTTAYLIDSSVPFVRNEIAAGNLRAKKLGRKVVVTDSALNEYLESKPDWKGDDSLKAAAAA